MAAMGLRLEEWMGGRAGVSAIRMLRRRGWEWLLHLDERGEEPTELSGLLGRRDRVVCHSIAPMLAVLKSKDRTLTLPES